jgi:hypothetical protein
LDPDSSYRSAMQVVGELEAGSWKFLLNASAEAQVSRGTHPRAFILRNRLPHRRLRNCKQLALILLRLIEGSIHPGQHGIATG